MRKIEFRAGYYEWLVIVDGDTVHAFGDFGDRIEENDKEEVVCLVDDLLWAWKKDCIENEQVFPLTIEEESELFCIMTETICEYCGVN